MVIRAKTLKSWLKANLREDLPYIAQHGAVAGFPGLTYYRDTSKLYDHFHGEIWEMVNNMAEQTGGTPLELIASFNGASNVTDDGTLKNLLVWFAAEEYARQMTEGNA